MPGDDAPFPALDPAGYTERAMQFFDTATHSPDAIRRALTQRDTARDLEIETTVRAIVDDVRARGDAALLDYTRRFDWPDATLAELETPNPYLAFAKAWNALPDELRDTMVRAEDNITCYHEAEQGRLQSWMDFAPVMWGGEVQGTTSLGQKLQPVERAGFYIPGGKAIYPSTVLMTMLPAWIAGVRNFVVCTPPDRDGNLAPLMEAMLYRISGVFFGDTHVVKVGGAQAVAAMAYGTDTVPKVDVIVGPGNAYVNTAKRLVYGQVGLDGLAGPSEVALVVDDSANPAFAAADLLAQTEHGPDNRGVVFSPSQPMLDAVIREWEGQRATLSRQDVLNVTQHNTLFVHTRDMAEALELVNVYAPEHLHLMVNEPLSILPLVRNAGAVLLGNATSASFGDYWAGPSHTLPTAGAARFQSPLSVATFLKRTSVLYASPDAAASAAEDIARFADAEGFDGHARAARLRQAPPAPQVWPLFAEPQQRGAGEEVP